MKDSTRRAFLGTAAAALGGVVLAPGTRCETSISRRVGCQSVTM